MRIILLIIMCSMFLFSFDKIGEDKEGVVYYCVEGYVYAYLKIGDKSEKILIPVGIETIDNRITKLECDSFNQWLKESEE